MSKGKFGFQLTVALAVHKKEETKKRKKTYAFMDICLTQ